jgi:FkbM family methyltransferase
MNLKSLIILKILSVLSRLRKSFIGKHVTAVLCETDQGKFLVDASDMTVGRKLSFNGEYDLAEISFLKHLVNSGSNVLIVGTHVGSLLIPISHGVKKIIGYEANPKTFQLLQTNIFLNNIKNTLVHNLAAGDSTGEIEFYANKINSGGSKIKPKKDSNLYNYDRPELITVPMVSLDEHLKDNDNNFDLIIMDIEGSEYFALKGMQKILVGTQYLYIEYVPHHLKNVANVTNDEFLLLLSPHFKSFKIIGEDTFYSISEAKKLLDNILSSNISVDILFSK